MKCKHCRKNISEFARECPYCHTPVESNAEEVIAYTKKIKESLQSQEMSGNTAGVLRKNWYFSFIACLLTATMLVGILYEKRWVRWEFDENTISYLTDESLIVESIKSEKKEKLTSYSLEDQVQAYHLFLNMSSYYLESEKNHCIYYPEVNEGVLDGNEDGISLYRQDMQERYQKEALVSDKVISAVMDQQENLYYLTKDSEVVTRYDGVEKQEIEVSGIRALLYHEATNQVFAVTVETTWLYSFQSSFRGLEERSYALYYFDWENKQAEKAFNMSNMLFSLGNQETAYYIDGNILYRYGLKSREANTIATNVQCFTVEQDEEKERVYYCCYSLAEHSYYDFVKDGFVKEDKGSQDEAAVRRKTVRERLKQQSLYTMKSDLYCYEDGKSSKVAEDMVNAISIQIGMPSVASVSAVSRQKEIKPTYELHQDASDTVESIQQYYKESVDQGNIYLDSLYDWEREDGTLVKNTVMYSEDNVNYILKDKKILQEEKEVKSVWAKSLTRTKAGETYYYDEEEEVVKRKSTQSNNDETVAENVFAFQILGDGTIIVMSSKEEGGEYNLYQIDKSGNQKLIAERVWGLLGTETCYIKSAYELKQVEDLEFK